MSLEEFLKKLNTSPNLIDFKDTISVIDAEYTYTPVSFTNGEVNNQASENEGSCKLLFFAKLHQIPKQQTLACFGSYYRDDVLNNPFGEDHQNIRNFMLSGWQGVEFQGEALVKK